MINGGKAGAALTCQVYCCVSGLPERSPDIATAEHGKHDPTPVLVLRTTVALLQTPILHKVYRH